MEIKDLSARMGNVDIVLDIAEKGAVREFDKFGKKGRVCNVVCTDSTGKISLTLWNDDVDKVNTGDTIHIKNGWVGEYQGELQLSTGKFGELILKEKSIGKQSVKSAPNGESKTETKQTKVDPKKSKDPDEDLDVYTDEESVDD